MFDLMKNCQIIFARLPVLFKWLYWPQLKKRKKKKKKKNYLFFYQGFFVLYSTNSNPDQDMLATSDLTC